MLFRRDPSGTGVVVCLVDSSNVVVQHSEPGARVGHHSGFKVDIIAP